MKQNNIVNSYYSPRKQNNLKKLQLVKKNINKKNIRAKKEINRLKNQLNIVHSQMQNTSNLSLQKLLDSSEISKNQCDLIKKIFATAKAKTPKGRRYSEK